MRGVSSRCPRARTTGTQHMPRKKKPEIDRDPDDRRDRHEPEIPDVPKRDKPDMGTPPPDEPEVDAPVTERDLPRPRR